MLEGLFLQYFCTKCSKYCESGYLHMREIYTSNMVRLKPCKILLRIWLQKNNFRMVNEAKVY